MSMPFSMIEWRGSVNRGVIFRENYLSNFERHGNVLFEVDELCEVCMWRYQFCVDGTKYGFILLNNLHLSGKVCKSLSVDI
ncbi:hypothetical protein B0O79_0756 [Flavobacteriaceae bacterium MAR_2009_75]|nr:hypothetical protein B0O79_0756 [Flavobacteriaceae bacterium MAR_2009_75]